MDSIPKGYLTKLEYYIINILPYVGMKCCEKTKKAPMVVSKKKVARKESHT